MATTVQTNAAATLFDALLDALRAAAVYNQDDMVAPAAILWPDERREWERLLPRLRLALPQLLTLGPYDKEKHTGPAIWLRCALAGKVPEISLPPGSVPVIYLPGVSRATIRATEECPADLKPLAELQYRGVFWSQANAKDWTVSAFLQSERGGLGLKLAKDAATGNSIRRALDRLVDAPVADLKARAATGQLDSHDFDALISDDLVDDLLTWLSDPKGSKECWDANRWETLRSRCVADYGFDPASDGELVGAEKLGTQDKTVWKTAWKRFAAAPSRYPGLFERLRRARPPKTVGSLFDNERTESWPQDNEAGEADLRQALGELSSESAVNARTRLRELEQQHQHRREWVWAKLGRAPLAGAVTHLATLADVTATALGGATTADMIRAYTEDGWRADAAVLDALAAVTSDADRAAVCTAIAQVYAPWLRDAAELFQKRVKAAPLPGRESPRQEDVPAGTCVLFADGLRFDVGQKLKAALEGKVGSILLTHHTAALPTVTPTAKPAVSPVADRITGVTEGEEFRPSVAEGNKDLTPDRFRKLLEGDGFQVLAASETGEPEGRAWTEFGHLDRTGHAEGIGLARRILELIAALVSRIEALLAAGWREVRVVTDHGWLLLPGGLPRTDLPKYLTATRWRRCAVVKLTATVDLPSFSWFWSDDVRIACPPGIDCFLAGEEYNHGGLSLQECVVPTLTIRPGTQAVVSAKIEQVKWKGLRCHVKVGGPFGGCKVDLRGKAADASTSLASAKAVGDDGTAAIAVEDDRREGDATNLVLLDAGGNVIDKKPVTVGG